MRMNSVILADPTAPMEYFDQVNASLVSNSFNQKNFHKFLKSAIKKCRKAILTDVKPEIPRSCSWLSPVMDRLRTRTRRRVQELALLQTRASGYPDDGVRRESLQKWVDTVAKTEVPIEVEVDLEEIRDYLDRTLRINAFTVKDTHVSLGVSAFYENPRSKGGKTAFARELIKTVRTTNRVCLDTGTITCDLILADNEPGEFLLHYSLAQAKREMESVLKVRASTVDEVGMKARIITVPSFFHSACLSPWAHLTYQALKTSRETRSGVSGTNHAWEMSMSLTASDPDLSWMFRSPDGDVEAFNSDLSEATDRVWHDAIKTVLDSVQAVMPVRSWYFEMVKTLLSSSRPFSAEMENVIISGATNRGVFMGDHGSKTILTVSGMYALAGMNFPRLSRLVGDDQCTVSAHAEQAGTIYRSRMESLGYAISEDDTFISRTAFFAEEGFEVETNAGLTTEVFLSRKRRSGLPFHDVPKVKILSDAGKDMGLFSELAIGKITLLATRMEQSGRTFCEGLFHLASWIQDICMSLLYRKEFIYFPRFLVQTGKPILFGCQENAKAFLRMHRCSRLQTYYADIIEEALRPPERSVSASKYIVQSFLTHSAKDENLRVVELTFPDRDFEQHRVLTNEAMRGYEPYLLSRLKSKIISESEIVAKLAEREQLLGERPETKRLTVYNLAKGKQALTDELLTEFVDLWQSNSKLLRFGRRERYYDREAIEALLGNTHPLRVSGLLEQLPLQEEAELVRSEHDRNVNILYEWVMSNPQRLDDVPRALIRDDLVLLTETYLTSPRLLIVSDDMKLVKACAIMRSINWRQPRETFHISVNDWVLSDLTAGTAFEPNEVFMDEGALDGYLDKLDAAGLEPPFPDGKGVTGRYRPIRPTGPLRLPTEVMEANRLRDELPSIAEI